MHDNEFLKSLQDLKSVVQLEYDNVRERLWETERYLINRIEVIEDVILSEQKQMMEALNKVKEVA